MSDPTDSEGEARIAGPGRREAESLSLVLAAEGIPHQVRSEDGRWWVSLEPADRERAEAAFALWKRENTAPAAPVPEPEPAVDTWAGLWLAGALLAAFAWTGEWSDANPLFDAGANDARLVVSGEWWRCVTALTLHTDANHAFGNAVSCALFATLLMRRYGAGAGLFLLLASGALGNFLSAEWHRAHHRSVGASTALFGAIGVLAATELVRRRGVRRRVSQIWLPLAGGLGLLAMLGTNRGSDLAAHFFGLAAGAGVGIAAARAAPRPLAGPAQAAFAALTAAVVALAWRLALGPS